MSTAVATKKYWHRRQEVRGQAHGLSAELLFKDQDQHLVSTRRLWGHGCPRPHNGHAPLPWICALFRGKSRTGGEGEGEGERESENLVLSDIPNSKPNTRRSLKLLSVVESQMQLFAYRVCGARLSRARLTAEAGLAQTGFLFLTRPSGAKGRGSG
jgi:hypothetical protein